MKNLKLTYLIFFLAIFTVYSLTISQNLSLTHDSVLYFYEIVNAETNFHPHHLLYHKFSELWFGLVQSISSINEITTVALLNAIFGAAAMTVLLAIYKERFSRSQFESIILTLLPTFSFGFWFYSLSIEVYIIPIFFILLGIYYLFDKSKSRSSLYLSALFFSISVLFHQMHFLLFVPIFAYLITIRKDLKFQNFALYFLIFFGVFGAVYLYVVLAIEQRHSISDIMYWLTYYSHVLPSWNNPEANLLVKIGVGFSRAFFTTYPIFITDFTREIIFKVYGEKSLSDEIFLLRNLPEFFAYLYFVLIALFGIVLIFTISKLKQSKAIFKSNKAKLVFLITFLVVYSIFFSFWDTQNLEFWIMQSILVWMIFGIFTDNLIAAHRKHLVLLVILLFTINLSFGVYQARDKNNDYYFASVKPAIEQQNSVFILENEWIIKYYIEYYTDSEIIKLENTNVIDFATKIEKLLSEYKLVLIENELIEENPEFRNNYKLIKNQYFTIIEKK